MRRWVSFLLPILLAQCLDGSTEGTSTPFAAAEIRVIAKPVQLDLSVSGRTQLGPLRFLGGWQLSSPARTFGGLSGLHVSGSRVTAISDIGEIVRFNIGRFGTVSNARIDPVPKGCANGFDDSGTDSESITADTDERSWWIGLEGRNEICRLDSTLTRTLGSARPPQMAKWPKRRGAESILRLADGRMLVIAEGKLGDITETDMLVFRGGDPTAPVTHVEHMLYRPPAGYNPTDASQLPDGRLLILHRRLSWQTLFTAKLSIVDLSTLGPGADVRGREIATFQSPIIADNYEGLAVSRDGDQTIVWIASDDNFMRWQKNVLLKFALIEAKN